MFADSGLPVYGIPPGDADDFCSKLSVAYERFKNSVGTRAGYSTLMFRLPAHYEWQYACRANSGKKHFADWPGNPETLAFDGFTNYREYLQKKNPDIYKRHQDLLDTFSGSETEMVRLLEDPRTENDKDLKSYIEGLLHRLLPLGAEVGVAAGEPPNVWNIRGLSGNVSEWVFVVDQPTADRANTPSSGDFAKGDVSAGYAGNWNASEVAMGSWEHFSIWQWQDNPTYSSKNQDRVRGQMTGIRIVMMDAVSETWFADLRQAAGQAFDGVVSADVVLGNFESGMEVAGRDKEGRSLAGARIRLYGALAKARAGSDAAASQMLREAVAGLKESGDEYFTQLEPLLSGDDFRN
jgi:hypothetical protein